MPKTLFVEGIDVLNGTPHWPRLVNPGLPLVSGTGPVFSLAARASGHRSEESFMHPEDTTCTAQHIFHSRVGRTHLEHFLAAR